MNAAPVRRARTRTWLVVFAVAPTLAASMTACRRSAESPITYIDTPVPSATAPFPTPDPFETVPPGYERAAPEVILTGRAQPYDATADEMQNGEHQAFIKAVVPGTPVRFVLDTVVMLGDEASVADGNTTYLNELPNGFYIRNLDPATVTLPISPTAAVDLVGLSPDGGLSDTPLRVPLDTFLGAVNGTPITGTLFFQPVPDGGGDSDRLRYGSLMDVTTANGIIVALEEQYLP